MQDELKAAGVGGFSDHTKLVMLVLPAIATSLAVTYDVGFFSGLNIEFFTFFSISEHLVFALQALPFALGPAIWMVTLYIGAIVTDKASDVAIARKVQEFQRLDPSAQDAVAERYLRSARIVKFVDPIVQFAFFALAAWMLSRQAYITAMAILFSTLVNMSYWRRNKHIAWRYFLICVVASAPFVAAFTIGFDSAQRLQSAKDPSTIVTVGMQDIPGIIVRAGDRGVLYFTTSTKKLLLLRWDNIKKLEAAVLNI